MVVNDPDSECLSEEPSFSDSEYEFVDHVSDEVLLKNILLKKPSEEEYKSQSIIVSGIPIVGEDRLNRLKVVLGKIFGRLSDKFTASYPMSPENTTKGYCFVMYPTAEIATRAAAVLDNYMLDRNHTFQVDSFTDWSNCSCVHKDWKPPVQRPFNDVGNLWSWAQNEMCYDHFAIHYDKEVSQESNGVLLHVAVYLYRKGSDPVLVGDRENWTEAFFKWSPYGTYLATVHEKGVALWAGETFKQFARFKHLHVLMIDFSPREKFLVTYDNEKYSVGNAYPLRIFEIRTGETLFELNLPDKPLHLPFWPYFQWSFDDKYFACLKQGGNGLNVYETETFPLIDKQVTEIDRIRSFRWSPTRSLLAYYREEKSSDNIPAEIGIMEFPSKVKLRAQRIFSVSYAELFWNSNGDRLAAHTERYQKKIVKSTEDGEDVKYLKPASHLEIFDARGRDISVLTLLLSEPFIAFGWEPAGDKFCLLVGSQHKSTPLIYYLDSSKHVPQLLSKFDSTDRYTHIAWAPIGGWLAVYSACSSSGSILFIDGNGLEPSRTNLIEYPGFDKGCWDATGRFFAAACTSNGGKGDAGYRIYTFQGRELYRKTLDRLLQFKWRPRLPVKLSDETIKKIKKNFKCISAKFEEEDRLERGKATKEVSEKRKAIMTEFKKILATNRERLQLNENSRLQLRDIRVFTSPTDKPHDLVDETITVALSTEKIRIKDLAPVAD